MESLIEIKRNAMALMFNDGECFNFVNYHFNIPCGQFP